MYIGLYEKCPLLLSDFSENLIFSPHFRKIFKYPISEKIRPVEAQLFRADRWIDIQTWRSYLSLFAIFRTLLRTCQVKFVAQTAPIPCLSA